MELVSPYHYQGYQVFTDNFYTSPKLFEELEAVGIRATGTLKTLRQGVPQEVKDLQMALKSRNIPRGTGYYFREPDSSAVYVCWHDNDCVTLMSTAYPGHQAGTTTHRGKDNAGNHSSVEVPLPSVVKHYNMFMGGVDKSDELVSYQRIICQTKKYWKTLLYHLLEIAAANSFILRKFLLLQSHQKTITESQFRDQLVQ
jgi:hypothetical protein